LIRIINTKDSIFFFDILDEYELYSNGPCWEGIVEQILEKDIPEALHNVDFDSEADTFLMRFYDEDMQLKVAKHIHIICADESKLREYLT